MEEQKSGSYSKEPDFVYILGVEAEAVSEASEEFGVELEALAVL
jgi:hypothetical protein